MTLAEALEKIKTLDGGADLVSAITAHTEELRKESQGYRQKAQTLEGEKTKLAEELDVSRQELETVRKAAPASGSPALEAELKRLRADLDAEKKAREDAVSQARSSKVQGAIKDALSKHKALRPDDLVDLHMPRVKFKEDGSPYFTDAAGAERSIDEHISTWLKDRPELVSSRAQSGPGGSSSREHGGQDLSKLSPTDRIALGLKSSH